MERVIGIQQVQNGVVSEVDCVCIHNVVHRNEKLTRLGFW